MFSTGLSSPHLNLDNETWLIDYKKEGVDFEAGLAMNIPGATLQVIGAVKKAISNTNLNFIGSEQEAEAEHFTIGQPDPTTFEHHTKVDIIYYLNYRSNVTSKIGSMSR